MFNPPYTVLHSCRTKREHGLMEGEISFKDSAGNVYHIFEPYYWSSGTRTINCYKLLVVEKAGGAFSPETLYASPNDLATWFPEMLYDFVNWKILPDHYKYDLPEFKNG